MLKKAVYYFVVFMAVVVVSVNLFNYDFISRSYAISNDENNTLRLLKPIPFDDNKVEKPDYYMLTDEKNVPVINEKFSQINKFDDNHVIVRKKDDKGYFGLIDLNGKYIIPAEYIRINAFPNPKGKYILAQNPYGQILFDKSGKKLLAAKSIISRGDFIVARNDFNSCTLYTAELKKLFSYRDEHDTQIIQKNARIYIKVYVQGDVKYLDLKGKEIKFDKE